MSTFRVTTVNLNGIRAAEKRGLSTWLEEEAPAVLLLQEVRADEDIAAKILGPSWATCIVPCRIKGRAGVAIAVHKDRGEIVEVGGDHDLSPRPFLYDGESDVDSGRWVEACVRTPAGSDIRVASAYFHSGEKDTPKQEAKMAHLERLDARMGELLASGESVVVAGDFNIVRSRSDIKNWTPNHNKRAGVLDEEIVFLDRWTQAGWRDVTRDLSGDIQGPYTWWSWRGKAFDNDAGWRIDYHFATPPLADTAQSFSIGRAASYDQRFSDHAPLSIDYSV
ncbi:MAG: exodeoxyribonuclease III [Actinomycetaceae bacterium]|nr:exodeoxyribonuclease III [Actinomycetaceae bacterium]